MHTRVIVIVGTALCVGCGDAPPAAAPKAVPAATVENPRTETTLTRVSLSSDAVARLGIQVVEVSEAVVPLRRVIGGEIIVPEGRSVIVAAPVTGTLVPGGAPLPGARVGSGQTLFRLLPLASADREQQIEADRAVAAADADANAARQRLQRLTQLQVDGATSVRSVEEATALEQIARAAVVAARERAAAVRRNPLTGGGEVAVKAPIGGILQTISVAPGQAVTAGAPMFSVAQIDTLWVRVPVYAGAAQEVDAAQPAAVSRLAGTDAARPATRVRAPLTADPVTATVNLFYELPRGVEWSPGERVSVDLPLVATAEGLSIPDSALLYDLHGTPWVYVDVGGGTYERRRIEIARQPGDRVVVARGLTVGQRVVTSGAAELFGTEFHTGK